MGCHCGIGAAFVMMDCGIIVVQGGNGIGLSVSIDETASNADATALQGGGTITLAGDISTGIRAEHIGTGKTVVSVDGPASVLATGADSYGINVTTVSGTYNVDISGSVMGGRGGGAGSQAINFSNTQAGSDIQCGGSLGALIDRAIVDGNGSSITTQHRLVPGVLRPGGAS